MTVCAKAASCREFADKYLGLVWHMLVVSTLGTAVEMKRHTRSACFLASVTSLRAVSRSFTLGTMLL